MTTIAAEQIVNLLRHGASMSIARIRPETPFRLRSTECNTLREGTNIAHILEEGSSPRSLCCVLLDVAPGDISPDVDSASSQSVRSSARLNSSVGLYVSVIYESFPCLSTNARIERSSLLPRREGIAADHLIFMSEQTIRQDMLHTD